MPLAPGTTLGPYRVTAKIGEGGMGEVYQRKPHALSAILVIVSAAVSCFVVSRGVVVAEGPMSLAGSAEAVRPLEQAKQSSPKISSATVRVGDINIHYRTAGEGEPLVLLHGFTHTSRAWEPFVAALSEDFTLIMPDTRGHGGSDNPSGEFTHRLAALDLFGLMDALGIDRFKGAGHSSGAVALVEAAVMDPDRIEAMVLVDGAHRFTSTAKESLSNGSPDDLQATLPGLYEALVGWHPGGEEQLRSLMALLPQVVADPVDGGLTGADLSAVTTRTLVAFGDRDNINPVELAVEMYRALPNAELWVMPNTFHGAVFGWEFLEEGVCPGCEAAAEVFPEAIRQFLKGR